MVKLDKCYWSFVREFIPSEERIGLKSRWNCTTRRDLSLAWLKDSLNRRNLQFQMFGFIASGAETIRVHYEKNACMRNMILLKKVCLLLDDIAELEFQIEVTKRKFPHLPFLFSASVYFPYRRNPNCCTNQPSGWNNVTREFEYIFVGWHPIHTECSDEYSSKKGKRTSVIDRFFTNIFNQKN